MAEAGQLPCLQRAANQAKENGDSPKIPTTPRSWSTASIRPRRPKAAEDGEPPRPRLPRAGGTSTHGQAVPAGDARVPDVGDVNPSPARGQARCRRASACWNVTSTRAIPRARAKGRFCSDSETAEREALAATLDPAAVTPVNELVLNALRSAMADVPRSASRTSVRSVDIVNTLSGTCGEKTSTKFRKVLVHTLEYHSV